MASSAAKLATLATTAWWSAEARLIESKRPDRLFDDPWAGLLLGQRHESSISARRYSARETRAFDLYAVITRYFDDFLLRTTAQPVRQVVVLASGLDTRAFRLEWPAGTRLFELEQPHVLTYKDVMLSRAGVSAACERHAVGVDLNEPWAGPLIAAGFDPVQPSVWLLEGFLYFLAETVVLSLLDTITALAASTSCIGLEVVNKAMLAYPGNGDWSSTLTDEMPTWLFATDQPDRLLDPAAWHVRSTEPGAGDADYGRAPYPLVGTECAAPRSFLVTATRSA